MTDENTLADPVRLGAIAASGVLEMMPDEDFERITAMAAKALGVPVSLVSLVTADRQFFPGACGLPAPYDVSRETPLTHSFCQHPVRERRPLVVHDAANDPRVRNNYAIRDLGVAAYLGVPLLGPDGDVFGAFCVIDIKPRHWTAADLRTVREFTALASSIIALHQWRARSRSDMDVVIHDLKTPLASLRMAADLLAETEATDPRQNALVKCVTDSTDSAIRLVESLARRERTREAGTHCLATVLERALDRLQSQAREKGCVIHFSHHAAGTALPAPAWIVERVVENLVSNAIKFGPHGGTVTVSATTENGLAILTVEDEGPGFSEEDIRYLYRRYSTLSAAPTGGEESTGLGLSLVKRMLERENGGIELVSAPGEPTKFRVALPIRPD